MPRIIALIYFIHRIYALFSRKLGKWGRFITGSNIKVSVELLEISCKMLPRRRCFLLIETLIRKIVLGVCAPHLKTQSYRI